MVGGVVSVAAGMMNPLIEKLTALMGDEYKKLKGVRMKASSLEKECSAIYATLKKLELMDELDPAVKDWRDHLREMSYDMENCIDDFMRQFGREDVEASLIMKFSEFCCSIWQRHPLERRMEELETLVKEAHARRERYKIDDLKPSSAGSVDVDPRLRAVHHGAASLVGIDGPMEELSSWLDTQMELKVLSIVGFGGLGKTTLAKHLYDKIRGKWEFHCVAFFSVSQKPDIKALLNRLEAKLDMTQTSHARGIEDIIQDISEHLKNKRYLIVVDDLWDESVWNAISRAFPNEGIPNEDNGSRVIVTTREEEVAQAACHSDDGFIYRIQPLNEPNSRMLFFKVFGSGDERPSYLEGVSADILKKCGGVPLAIITIASLLARQEGSMIGWENISSSPTLKDVKNILNLSYINLPLHLRACFLYLGMYPEDEEIEMSVVIREWVAEGLVSYEHGSHLMDVGRRYFNELINRSMIQPAGRTEDGELKSCRVHDIMLDLILSKCAEDNFLSVASSSEDITRLQGSKYNVRRLSLRSMAGGATSVPTIGASLLSQVRSCAWARNSMPPLLLFKYLRVLTLCNDRYVTIDLTDINQLFQLRYLRVVGGGIKFPCALKGLVYLETLDIYCGLESSFPSDIVHLPRLSYLRLPRGAYPIQGVENMKSLHALRDFPLAENSVKEIMGLGELTNLRELELKGKDVETPKIEAVASSVGKLLNLKYLGIFTDYSVITDESNKLGLLSSSPFKNIEILELGYWQFPRVPKWMGDLRFLRVLYLRAMETSAEDVHVLAKLPSLVSVELWIGKIAGERAVFGKGAFPVLEYFKFYPDKGDVTAFLVLEEGAMPKLRTLALTVMEWGGSIPVGMEHLVLLEKIDLVAWTELHKKHLIVPSSTGDDVFSVFRKASQLRPNRPSVSFQLHPSRLCFLEGRR